MGFWPKAFAAINSGTFFMQNELGNAFLARLGKNIKISKKRSQNGLLKNYTTSIFVQYDREKPWLLICSPENDFFEKDAQRHCEPFAPIFN